MKVYSFNYNSDNFAYLVESGGEALVIDGGAVDMICKTLEERSLKLVCITNTHSHPDHTQGNRALSEKTGVKVSSHSELVKKGELGLGSKSLKLMATPGHSLDSICFTGDDFIISGDTLFNGTVGNCFSGDLDAFFYSIEEILKLPENTKVYAGHDYVKEAMAYARSIDPLNPHLDSYLKAWELNPGFTLLKDELKVNPYLRYNDPEMIKLLESRGIFLDTPLKRWHAIMELY